MLGVKLNGKINPMEPSPRTPTQASRSKVTRDPLGANNGGPGAPDGALQGCNAFDRHIVLMCFGGNDSLKFCNSKRSYYS